MVAEELLVDTVVQAQTHVGPVDHPAESHGPLSIAQTLLMNGKLHDSYIILVSKDGSFITCFSSLKVARNFIDEFSDLFDLEKVLDLPNGHPERRRAATYLATRKLHDSFIDVRTIPMEDKS